MSGLANAEKVGWTFIEEYYSKLNEKPERLYQFYNSSSSMIHASEGDDAVLAQGQSEIKARIAKESFNNCKVLVSSVDCLPTLKDSIIVQVVGDMANAGQLPQKFVQTFFLYAQSPGKYLVLNDVLRYIKEDTVQANSTSVDQNLSGTPVEEPAQNVQTEIASVPAGLSPLSPSASGFTGDDPLPTRGSENGPIGEEARVQDGSDTTITNSSSDTRHKSTLPERQSESPSLLCSPSAPVEQASKPWGSEPWGSVPTKALAAQTKPRASGTSLSGPGITARRQNPVNSQNTNTKRAPSRGKPALAFVRGVSDEVSQSALTEALAKFGKVTYIQVQHDKSRAYVDFEDQAALDRALAQQKVVVGSTEMKIELRLSNRLPPSGQRRK